MNDIQVELSKLTQMARSPLDLSFLIGYLCSLLPLDTVTTMRPLLTDIINHVEQGNITPRSVLEILAGMKAKVLLTLKKEEGWLMQTQAQCAFIGLLIRRNLQAPYLQQSMVFQSQPMKEEPRVVCLICTLEILQMEASLFSCQHMYHQNCFESYSKQRIFTKNLPILCPNDGCAIELPLEQVTQHISRELTEKLDEFMFQDYVEHNMKDTSWCPTPGCEVVFSFQGVLQQFRCPSCRKRYCIHCKHEVHQGLSCQQTKEMLAQLAGLDEGDRKFMHLAKQAKFKQCPSCKFWVEKNQGCDHMTCRCKHEFCYICGGKYGNCDCGSEEDSEAQIGEYQSEQEQSEMQSIVLARQFRPIEQYRTNEDQDRNFIITGSLKHQLSSYSSQSASQKQEELSVERSFKAETIQSSQPSLQFCMWRAKRAQRPQEVKMDEFERPRFFPKQTLFPAPFSRAVEVTFKTFSSIESNAEIISTTHVKRPFLIANYHAGYISDRLNNSIGNVPKQMAPYPHKPLFSLASPLRRAQQINMNPEMTISPPTSLSKLKFNFTYSNPLPSDRSR